MTTPDLKTVVTDYLDAFDARDLERCLGFYADTATIDFANGVYRGRQAIEEWHQDRFNADLRVLEVDSIRTEGETVVLDVVGTSQLARAWRFNTIPGRVKFTFEQANEAAKIKDAKFSLRPGFSFDKW